MAGIKDRLIQFILRGKDELSPAAKKSADALETVRQEAEGLDKALDSAKGARGLVTSLENTRRAASQSEQGLADTERRITELREALSQNPDAAGLQQSLKDAEREASRTRRALLSLSASLNDQEAAAKAAGIDTNNLADEERRLAAEVDNAKSKLTENSQQLKALQREQAAATRGAAEHTSRLEAARESMSRGAKQVLAFAAAYISLNAAFGLAQRGLNLVRDGIFLMLKTGDEFEGLDTRMASLMGSLAAGEQATAWIKEFAKDTPLALQDVTESFALLKSYGLDPMDGTLQALVDKNEQLGGGMERLQGIVSAVGQAWAKEKLQTEEILQLVERGVPVWQMLADVTGKNAAELQELASKGKLGRDVIRQLVVEIGKSADGAAAANMSRLSGIMSNLADVATDFYNRIANAGALDYVKGRLMALAETIDQMDKDGRLDALATSLSNAFIQGAQWVENFAAKLLTVDFAKLTTDSSNWLNTFGTHLDDAAQRVQLFIAPFRTMFNGLTAGLSGFAALLTNKMSEVLGVVGKVADALPDKLGGAKLRAAVAEARGVLDGLTEGFREQIEQDGKDIESAWTTNTETVKTKAAEQTEVVKKEADDQFEHIVQRVTDMNNALAQIDAAAGAAQLKQLGDELYQAYQRGDLSQQQFANGTALLQSKLRALGGTTASTGDELTDLKSIMSGIGRAANEVDFNRLRAAMRKAYSDGKISAEEFAQAQAELNDRVAQLKPAAESSTRAVREQSEALSESTEAAGAGIRRLSGDTEEASGGMNWFAEVLTRARTPLAEMSAAALDAFDAMQGINSIDPAVDTSSLEKTTESLQKAKEQALLFQGALDLEGSRASGLGRWMMETFIRSEQVKVSFLGQKRVLQELMRDYESGSISTEQFARSAANARRNLNLLDESDLSSLDGAIEAAHQKMQALGDSTRSTLEGLQMELLQLQGTEEEIEKARFASRRRDLQAQQSEARQSGDSTAVANLQQALRTLSQIERESTSKREREAQQKQVEQVAKVAPVPAQQPAKIIRLETSRGQTVEVGLQSADDETRLLGILESAGLRSR
ncbi:tape measure protein [Pseudomonas sp. NPDC047963]